MTASEEPCFRLSPVEKARARAWREQHEKDHPMKNTGAIGGRWGYLFISTGIGDVVSVRCTCCGAEKDVTDYDHW